MISPRDLPVLHAIARYYVLNRAQIQRLCFPEDRQGRITRRHLAALGERGLIARTRVELVVPGSGSTAPVFYPTRKGLEYLVEECDDRGYLGVATRAPLPQHIFHWLAISETHIALDCALARQEDVRCLGWLNEWDTADEAAATPEKKFTLYTLIQDRPRLVCAPDAALLLHADGHAKVFYLEQDRNTSGIFQIAASKTAGYAAMAERRLHRRHFPQATVDPFSVLMVAPSERRRDALAKAIAEKPGAPLWRFATASDLTPQAFLGQPIWRKCDGQMGPLVKPKEADA